MFSKMVFAREAAKQRSGQMDGTRKKQLAGDRIHGIVYPRTWNTQTGAPFLGLLAAEGPTVVASSPNKSRERLDAPFVDLPEVEWEG